jgi:hypothetical protein
MDFIGSFDISLFSRVLRPGINPVFNRSFLHRFLIDSFSCFSLIPNLS